jgi:hypothetical protein
LVSEIAVPIGINVAHRQPKRHAIRRVPVHLALRTRRRDQRDHIRVLVLAVVEAFFERAVAGRGPCRVRVFLPERDEVDVRAAAKAAVARLVVDEAFV